mmetsp:Transcript_37014/g.98011  ORF Transcript_37014/g.98011 Transcript_37014/m.98011 type:complete len:694 (+) Transcript_37014:47-2128(+)|eukprot:CAMPEP_0115844134 /NCGR_PEP_ID=MMETSP0287-20121206/8675_1 /TAXON_ID=412157 /ORGANISM="Chrysochromulina rotalis, Strain UIO044" /LENGTH=693 /DNA_ID=CAMNT_0003297857 /DNA_START=29 /DNA_END=2110 /DNA_ORIENTATION=-
MMMHVGLLHVTCAYVAPQMWQRTHFPQLGQHPRAQTWQCAVTTPPLDDESATPVDPELLVAVVPVNDDDTDSAAMDDQVFMTMVADEAVTVDGGTILDVADSVPPLMDTLPGPVDVHTLELPQGIDIPMALASPDLAFPPGDMTGDPDTDGKGENEEEEEEEEDRVPIFEVALPDLPESVVEEAAAAAAEAEGAEDSVLDLSPLPGLGELAAFCLPTLGIWLSSPLLSLIDTSVVGISCVETQLAALAPSTKLCDYVAFFCTVIAAATTNLAAEKFARDDPTQAKRIIGGALMVSLVLGVAIAAALGLMARPLMLAMLGSSPNPAVLSAATDYTAIRALGYPAALMVMTLQAAFIATKDATTPLLAVPVTALVNLGGDLALVRHFGAAGTAWATVASLYVNAAALIVMWAKKVRTYAGEHIVLTWPTRAEFEALFSFAAPMMVALVARVYMGLSVTLAAVACGTTALATNQVIESLYWLFCPFGDAVSLCMQAYLPPLLLGSRALAKRLQSLAFRAAAALGVIVGLGATTLPLLAPGLFTTSVNVVHMMASTAPMLGVAVSAYVLSCTIEGVLVARKQLRFLAISHVSNTLGLVAALAWMRRRPAAGLAHVWVAIAVINLARIVEFRWGLARSDADEMREKWAASLSSGHEERRGLRWRFYKVIRRREPKTDQQKRVDAIVPDIASEFPDLIL